MISLLLAVIYLSFISLGLPDSLLGSAWPNMYAGLGVPLSDSGVIFMIISVGTVVSSLQSDRLTKWLGAGRVTAISVAMTAIALLGFSVSRTFAALCLWAVPYGLGAGSVDAALNNYVALHFASRHMSWLHCMWGVGASIGPYVMSEAITAFGTWNAGYRIIGILQLLLSAVILLSLPLWQRVDPAGDGVPAEASLRPIPLREVVRLRGAKEILLAFFCYCALEQTVSLWASSFLVLQKGVPEVTATAYAGLFFLGITAGRAANGFLTLRRSDPQLIRLGMIGVGLGVLLLFLPSLPLSLAGYVVLGVGCAPIYPCVIHSTPRLFGAAHSQAMVGVQMASAYIGTSVMPPLFGLIARHISLAWFPVYLIVILAVMAASYRRAENLADTEKFLDHAQL